MAASTWRWSKAPGLQMNRYWYVHSSMIGDVFGSERFGRGHQLHRAMEMIEAEGKGVIVYIQKGDGPEGWWIK